MPSLSKEQYWPSAAAGWWTVAALSFAYVISYVDRIVINLLVEPIKADLALSDAQFAALQALAFGLFYTLMALPIGWLADRRSRRNIAAAGVGLFSLFSVASGFAQNYWQLFIARSGVGIGEASLTPTAHSLISDSFPPEKLGRAMSVFVTSAFVGIGLAYLVGAAAIRWLSSVDLEVLPVVSALRPWQAVFVIVGLPGLILALLLMTIKEPARRESDGQGAQSSLEALRLVRTNLRLLGPMFAGFSMVSLASYAGTVWTPALFVRVHDWTPSEIGTALGVLYLVFGTAGALSAGWLCDRLTQRGRTDAPLWIALWAFVGHGIFGGLAPLMPTAEATLALLAPSIFLGTVPYPLAAIALQLIAPGQFRAQLSALYMVIINVIGLGVGPLLVGLLTDRVFTEPADVRYSLAVVIAGAAPIGLLLLAYALRPYRASRANGGLRRAA